MQYPKRTQNFSYSSIYYTNVTVVNAKTKTKKYIPKISAAKSLHRVYKIKHVISIFNGLEDIEQRYASISLAHIQDT